MQSTVASMILHRRIEEVWPIIGRFHALATWHPAVEYSGFDEGYSENTVGCIRNVRLSNGSTGKEKLVKKDEKNHTLTYSFEISPLPVENYLSTIQLLPTTDIEYTHMIWTGSYTCEESLVDEMHHLLKNGVYLAGMHALATFNV